MTGAKDQSVADFLYKLIINLELFNDRYVVLLDLYGKIRNHTRYKENDLGTIMIFYDYNFHVI